MNFDPKDKLGKFLRDNQSQAPAANSELKQRVLKNTAIPPEQEHFVAERLPTSWIAPALAASFICVAIFITQFQKVPVTEVEKEVDLAQTMEKVANDWELIAFEEESSSNAEDQIIEDWLSLAEEVSQN